MSFVRRKKERKIAVKNGAQGGPGQAKFRYLINEDSELLDKGSLYSEIILEKGCGVGWHIHEGNAELYFILSGEAEYNNNGEVTTVRAGDLTFTGPGEGHAITNNHDEPLRFIALIINA